MELHLHIATIYPEIKTSEMYYNLTVLRERLHPHVTVHDDTMLPVGYFKKGVDSREVADTEEVAQRNKYVRMTPENHFFLILDSDETIGGSLELLPQIMKVMLENDVLVGQIAEIRPTVAGLVPFKRNRLILKKRGMRYVRKHDVLIHDGVNIIHKDYQNYAQMHQIQFLHNIVPLGITITNNLTKEVAYSSQ